MKTLGKYPSSQERIDRINNSPNFKNGTFKNIHPTSMNNDGGSTLKTIWKFLKTKKPIDIKPSQKISGFKIDLNKVNDETPALIWFGHSSYLIKYQGKNILVDPVFSGNAAPISIAVKAFEGSDIYQVEDLPPIDFLILTHDHYDHIDYETVLKLKSLAKHIVCPLGVGEHLEFWDFDPKKIIELDWWEAKSLFADGKITATPARHFSGRSLTRNKTLWCSFALELGSWKIFIGGDSGYDDQFKKIGEKFKSFDLALVECGQYGVNWPYIHMFPEQTVQAARDLNAKALMPVHWGKFILSTHSWTEPIERALVKAEEIQQTLCTPQIGEVVKLGEKLPNSKWWRF